MYGWLPVPLHFKVPHGIHLIEATAVAVDSEGNCYCFNRGNIPVLVFDPEGNLLRHWGNPTPFEGSEVVTDPYGNTAMRFKGIEFRRAHAITIDHEDNVWLVDDSAHAITKCDRFGKRLMMLIPPRLSSDADAPDQVDTLCVLTDVEDMRAATGIVHQAPPKHSGLRFNRPTDVAVHPTTGEIFVSDGYGNSCVHRLSATGEHISTWGRPGTGPGEFNLPHSIAIDTATDTIVVADRESSRLQFFALDGTYLKQWFVHRATAVDVVGGLIYAAEQGSKSLVQRGGGPADLDSWVPNIGNCVGVYRANDDTPSGNRLTRIGAATGSERPDAFIFPHSLAVTADGRSLYVAEVSFCECGRHQKPHAREMTSLRLWRRVDGGGDVSGGGDGIGVARV
jgi:DNA-binding beta-propeller fold protein YncE|tara:strand:- start:65 stop:1246 length:1182 start_codon:yes stop_codon:yes gene_type:complete